MTTAKKAFFLYRDWCIAKYLREDANWADYPEIFVSAWEYAWNDGFDTVSHESIYTNTELRSFIRMTAGMECHEIPLYPEMITTPLLRRLVEQEGAGISQLARLTGLARGDMRRRPQ